MLRIVVEGEGSRAVELCIRTAMGEGEDDEQWLITAVKLPARWVVSFLVSPDDRLGGYTWCGPAHQVRSAVEEALRSAGLGRAPGYPPCPRPPVGAPSLEAEAAGPAVAARRSA